MRWISAIAHELFGLFVDDGLFALGILAWLGAAALMLPRLPLEPEWRAPIVFTGLILLLGWTCGRAIVRHGRKSG